jgi:hypothetical protein
MSLGALFVRRRHTWLIVAVGIALYCVFVGASASVVRAGIMGILLVIAGGLIHPALGQAFGWLAWPFLVWTTGIVEGVAALPFANFDTGPLPIALAVLYHLLLGAAAAYLVLPPARRAQLKAALPRASRRWAALEVVRVGDDAEGLSLRLSYGQVSVYGDGGETQELASAPDAVATVLRVGRHGDAKAATPQLLTALAPQFAIISVGVNNTNAAQTLDVLYWRPMGRMGTIKRGIP